MQMPPAYSALKFRGRPSYDFARKGVKVELRPRMVNIYNIRLVSSEEDLLTIKVECGSGTYIRSLAYKIGEMLGCGASVKGLKRTKIGEFDIKSSISVKDFTGRKITSSDFKSSTYLISIERMLEESPSLYIKDKYRKNILSGHQIKSEMLQPEKIKAGIVLKKGTLVNIKDSNSNLLAVHRVLKGDALLDIKQKGIALTGSRIVFDSQKIL